MASKKDLTNNQTSRWHIRGNLRRSSDLLFQALSLGLLCIALSILVLLVYQFASAGFARLSIPFLTQFPSRFPEQAGILSAWVGTLYVMLVTASIAIPLGIAAGIYLEEYSKKNILRTLIEINIANMAGVPSIIYGLLALGLFVHQLNLGHSILTAGMTLSLLVMPIIIVATREALKTVPLSMREAAYALGATKWQMIWHHVLPYSMGGILTGIIIALSRAIGETAPLITVGALTFIAFLPHPIWDPSWLQDPFTVLPIQLFNWVSRPQVEFHQNAAAAGIVLLIFTLGLNSLAIALRHHYRKKVQW